MSLVPETNNRVLLAGPVTFSTPPDAIYGLRALHSWRHRNQDFAPPEMALRSGVNLLYCFGSPHRGSGIRFLRL